MTKRTELGKELAKFRIDHDMTAKKMAVLIGYSPGFLAAIEFGRISPTITFLDKVSSALRIDVSQFKYLALESKSSGLSLDGFDPDSVNVVRAVLAGLVEFPRPFHIDKASFPTERFRLERISSGKPNVPSSTQALSLARTPTSEPDVPDVPGVGFLDEDGELDDL